MSLLSMLTQNCHIQRPAQTVNVIGEVTKANYVTVASGVPFSIQAGSDSESVEFGRRFGTVMLRAYFQPSQDVRIEDRIANVGGTGAASFTSKLFDVVSPVNDTSGRGNHVTCLLKEHV
jgi:hypothetical protein